MPHNTDECLYRSYANGVLMRRRERVVRARLEQSKAGTGLQVQKQEERSVVRKGTKNECTTRCDKNHKWEEMMSHNQSIINQSICRLEIRDEPKRDGEKSAMLTNMASPHQRSTRDRRHRSQSWSNLYFTG